MAELTSARYGKDNIRLFKVIKDEKKGIQSVVELTVRILLEGDIDSSYTQADNSVVVATDTQKQTAYILAKQNPVSPPEVFASLIGDHFVNTYPHIHGAYVNVIQHKWTRMLVDGKPHPHSFHRDGAELRIASAHARDGGHGIALSSRIEKLLVLKSTGSGFHSFHRDEYTQLPETWDRILSTDVECSWNWSTFGSLDEVKAYGGKFDDAWQAARDITTKTFAEDNSASVQNTMYKMCEQILAKVPKVESVDYSLPNKHYFEINLEWHKGLKNLGKDAEVYAPQSDPNGLIQCRVSRKGTKSKL